MSMKAPIAVESAHLSDHPAARAWKDVGGQVEPATVELWRKSNATKPAIYRLTFESSGQPAVFAKRSLGTNLALERRIYEEVLPHLPLTTPRYYGFRKDDEGSAWLFIEDVGGQRFSVEDPEQRLLAARWLGLLHRSAADLPAAAWLPDAGLRRYLGHLRSAREKIRRSLGNPVLAAEGRAILNEILVRHDELETRWQEFERACEGMPATLVHGDFRPKNVRVRADGAAAALYPIDWEMAGWGIAAADLALARGPGLTMSVEPITYETVVRERWPDLDAAAIRRLSVLGHLFRALAGIEWASESLTFERPDYLLQPLSSMRSFARRISEALEAAAEWLG